MLQVTTTTSKGLQGNVNQGKIFLFGYSRVLLYQHLNVKSEYFRKHFEMSRTVAFGRDILNAPDVDIEVILYNFLKNNIIG